MLSPRLIVAMLAVAATLLVPAAANAASVAVSSGTLTITAAGGEANQLTLAPGVGTVDVTDPAAPLVPGPGCAATGAGRLTCTASPLMRAVVDLGDLDDTLVIGGLVPAVVTDGPGRDTVTGGGADDEFVAGPGADAYAGGGGSDRVTYAARSAALV